MSRSAILSALSIRRISAAYVLVFLIILFSILLPETFPTTTTLTSVLNDQAVTALVAVALVIPFASQMFDLSVAAMVSLSSVVCAHLMVISGHGIAVSIAAALGVGLTSGLLMGLAVTKWNIDSFIATLGVSSILAGFANAISDQLTIVGLPDGFLDFANYEFVGLTSLVLVVLVIAAAAWWLTERTVFGRRLYATGGNIDAARLAGVPVDSVRVLALALSGLLTAAAGVLATAQFSSGSASNGSGYLLPAFAAAFLGTTQVRVGRVNVIGTVLAVYTLATGVKGLQLMGAPFWIADAFNGLALLAAVALANNPIGKKLKELVRRKPGAGVTSTPGREVDGQLVS